MPKSFGTRGKVEIFNFKNIYARIRARIYNKVDKCFFCHVLPCRSISTVNTRTETFFKNPSGDRTIYSTQRVDSARDKKEQYHRISYIYGVIGVKITNIQLFFREFLPPRNVIEKKHCVLNINAFIAVYIA